MHNLSAFSHHVENLPGIVLEINLYKKFITESHQTMVECELNKFSRLTRDSWDSWKLPIFYGVVPRQPLIVGWKLLCIKIKIRNHSCEAINAYINHGYVCWMVECQNILERSIITFLIAFFWLSWFNYLYQEIYVNQEHHACAFPVLSRHRKGMRDLTA